MTRALLLLQSLVFLPLILISNRAAAPVLAIAVVAAALRRQPLGRFGALPPLFALLGFGALSALWSIDPGNSLGKVGQLAAVAVAAFALAGTADRRPDADRDRLARLALIGWSVAVAIPLLDALAHAPIVAALRAAFGSFGRLDAAHLAEKGGVTALVLATVPAIAAYRRLRLPPLGAAAMLAAAIAAAASVDGSAAVLLPLVGASAWLLHAVRPRLSRNLLRFGLPCAVLAMPLLPMLVDPAEAVRTLPQLGGSWVHRLVIWDFAYDHILERPWLGWGLDAARVFPGAEETFTLTVPLPGRDLPFALTATYLPLHTHNGPLQIWLELGAAGAAIAAFGLWRMLSAAIAPTAADAPLCGLFAAAAVPFLVSFGVFQSWWLALVVLLWAATRALIPPSAE
ncbi:putative O-antigen polymerase [uncultured Alphaproteobacteria bacterium]|uniref:Putative O-antigen polymerase n=1 Tax=uncultured Alphaproteobacteria bacterium TaxID=91750 RepID=A0A212KGU0_9PROT|nr:putative O-antigen polymerase [uncultured Alphaproteobacteria bacterium]